MKKEFLVRAVFVLNDDWTHTHTRPHTNTHTQTYVLLEIHIMVATDKKNDMNISCDSLKHAESHFLSFFSKFHIMNPAEVS